MDRDEQVGALLAGDLGTLAQRNEVIAGTRQFGAEAFLTVDLTLQLFGDRQHDVFFMLALGARGARVFATVTGVDGDDDVTLAIGHRGQLDRRLRRGHRHRRRGGDRRGRRRGDGVGLLVEQIDHQAVAVLRVGRQGEALGRHRLLEVNHHAQVGGRTLGRAHAGNRGVGGGH
ncbi:hypothetical protein D9M71_667080 [compost metagenome]